jgi:hypothetical protein
MENLTSRGNPALPHRRVSSRALNCGTDLALEVTPIPAAFGPRWKLKSIAPD